jgi:hypothetical protein
MDVVLTYENAPPPNVPPTAQEVAHFETVLFKSHESNNRLLYIDEMLSGFNGIYDGRVPDTFLDLANKYMTWSDINLDNERQQQRVDMFVRTADNGNKDLRRLYAFWLDKCAGKITEDTRCFVILRTIHRMCVDWAVEQDMHLYSLLWKSPANWPDGYIIANQNDLVDQIKEYLFRPDRVRRLTSDYIRQLIEPMCEN